MGYNLKLEDKIKQLGFKKKWLSDKSGYWFERHYKIKDLGLECKFYIETDKNLMVNSAKVGQYFSKKIENKIFDDFKAGKVDLKYITKILKKYDK